MTKQVYLTPREHVWTLALLLGPVRLRGRSSWEMADGTPVDHARCLLEIDAALRDAERLRAALEHIAAGNISPCITFAERILAGDTVEQAHEVQRARWRE